MWQAVVRIKNGVAHAVAKRPGVVGWVTLAVFALNLLLPPAILTVVREPLNYFTFNPWLPGLPAYLVSSAIPLAKKLDFLPGLALFWFSADSPFGGTDWGFAVTVADLFRYVTLSVLFGVYFALVLYCRDLAPNAGLGVRIGRGGGISGAFASVLGVSTGGCTVMGCGAPMLPVVGLAFVGLSSGTLALLAALSRVATVVVLLAVIVGVLWFGWIAGGLGAGLPPKAKDGSPLPTEEAAA
jgi:hypothetical protein